MLKCKFDCADNIRLSRLRTSTLASSGFSPQIAMALARSLRQFTPTLTFQLFPTGVQSCFMCGLHQQLPSAVVSLSHLESGSQLQQYSSHSWGHYRQHFTHPSKASALLAARRSSDRSSVVLTSAGKASRRQPCDLRSHTQGSWLQHRSFATDTAEADEIKYPVRTPDSVFVYNGPLALTVSRLKVTVNVDCS